MQLSVCYSNMVATQPILTTKTNVTLHIFKKLSISQPSYCLMQWDQVQWNADIPGSTVLDSWPSPQVHLTDPSPTTAGCPVFRYRTCNFSPCIIHQVSLCTISLLPLKQTFLSTQQGALHLYSNLKYVYNCLKHSPWCVVLTTFIELM